MTKKYGFWSAVGDFFGAAMVPATGGASLVLSPTARDLATKIIGFGEDDDSTTKKLDEIKAQTETWKAQMAANQAERDRLREEKEKNDKDKKKNDDEIARLNAIINNPHSTDEEKKNARNRIVLLEGEIKELKAKNKKLDEDIEKLSKNPPPPSQPWTSYLPKLGFMDKIILAGGITLITYLLISKDEKKK